MEPISPILTFLRKNIDSGELRDPSYTIQASSQTVLCQKWSNKVKKGKKWTKMVKNGLVVCPVVRPVVDLYFHKSLLHQAPLPWATFNIT